MSSQVCDVLAHMLQAHGYMADSSEDSEDYSHDGNVISDSFFERYGEAADFLVPYRSDSNSDEYWE